MKARKKPVTIDFEIYDGSPESVNRIIDMYGQMKGINNSEYGLFIITDNSYNIAHRGDYIVKRNGVLKPMNSDAFHEKYEEIMDEPVSE